MSNPAPAAAGPSQSFGSRAHSQTQAAASLSGSAPSALKVAKPHDQMPWMPNSRATCLAASASHLITCSQAWREAPLRAPPFGADWNCSSSAILPAGMPIRVRCETSPRRLLRIRRLARTAPSL